MPYWAKNILVFVPAFLADAYKDGGVLLNCAVGFVLLSLCASATYVVNDILDVESDRRHATKRTRPLASQAVSMPHAALLAAVLAVAGLGAALIWKPQLAAALLAYCLCSILYTVLLKRLTLIDTFWLSGMHTARLVIGGLLADVVLSGWLIAFALVFFFSLSLAKRYCELVIAIAAGEAGITGRSYTARDATLLLSFGASSAIGSLVVLTLYVTDQEHSARYYAQPNYLWLSVLVIAVWLLHIWRNAQNGSLSADPVSFALRDRTSLMLFIGLLAAMWAAR